MKEVAEIDGKDGDDVNELPVPKRDDDDDDDDDDEALEREGVYCGEFHAVPPIPNEEEVLGER